jgi:cytochrome c biogenesis protein CcdA
VLLLLGAVLAGVLTTLAPCVLPLLPVIVGESVAPPIAGVSAADVGAAGVTAAAAAAGPGVVARPRPLTGTRRALAVTGALGVSVFAFTLLLQVSTALIGVPRQVWQLLSGGLLVALGLALAVPHAWHRLSLTLALGSRTADRLAAARSRDGLLGAVLTGAALGPVFSSCSPLYGYVIITLLPARPVFGLVLILSYVAGLCATLLVVALAGQRAIRRLRWAADPRGWFRRGLGLLLVGVGVLVLTGLDHALQTWVIENSPIRPWELDGGFVPPAS